MEHHICDIITQRMKNRKASRSIEEAGNPGKILAVKAPKKDGKGKGGNIHKGQIPFNNCYNTNGRKAIRNVFKMKSYSDLIYR